MESLNQDIDINENFNDDAEAIKASAKSVQRAKTRDEKHVKNISTKKVSERNSIVSSVMGIKFISVLSYLIFFLPLIFCRREPYAIFHANQSVALWLVMSLMYIIVALASLNVFVLLLVIIFHVLGITFGMYNAAHNRARHFWGMAKFSLFKAK